MLERNLHISASQSCTYSESNQLLMNSRTAHCRRKSSPHIFYILKNKRSSSNYSLFYSYNQMSQQLSSQCIYFECYLGKSQSRLSFKHTCNQLPHQKSQLPHNLSNYLDHQICSLRSLEVKNTHSGRSSLKYSQRKIDWMESMQKLDIECCKNCQLREWHSSCILRGLQNSCKMHSQINIHKYNLEFQM